MNIEHLEPGPRMSAAIGLGGLLFLSGQVADDPEGNLEQQSAEVFSKIERLLEGGRSDRSNILSATIWLTDPGNFESFNRSWDRWLGGAAAPTRATVVAQLVAPKYLLEIQIVAARNVTR